MRHGRHLWPCPATLAVLGINLGCILPAFILGHVIPTIVFLGTDRGCLVFILALLPINLGNVFPISAFIAITLGCIRPILPFLDIVLGCAFPTFPFLITRNSPGAGAVFLGDIGRCRGLGGVGKVATSFLFPDCYKEFLDLTMLHAKRFLEVDQVLKGVHKLKHVGERLRPSAVKNSLRLSVPLGAHDFQKRSKFPRTLR